MGPMARTPLTDSQRWTIAGVAAVASLLVVALLVLSADGDEDAGTAATSSTTAPAETTTTTTTTTTTEPDDTTTTEPFTPAVEPYAVAFPSPTASRSFEAPASAARAYATDVLGFTDLVIGAPSDTGGDTTEVVVQDREDGPETRIELVQGENGSWFVLGSTTDDITVTAPAPGTSLASPFETSGEALAFEGTVEVLVLTQEDPTPIGEGVVTGSGTPPPGPFSGRIEFQPPEEPVAGVVVYRTRSPEDGRVVQATSVRVRLTPFTS